MVQSGSHSFVQSVLFGFARPRRAFAAVVALALLGIAAVTRPPVAHADVTTYGNDNARTAWYADQAILSPGLLTGGTFGKLWDAQIDGQVYAQPLVYRDRVFIATETNNIYGIDTATGTQVWTRNLGVPFNPADVSCSDLAPTVGITGTPVIDTATGTAYFFKKTYANGTSGPAAYYAHAVDVATGEERPNFPVKVQGTASNDPTASFDATVELQRPGLLLLNGVVYAAFGGHCDYGYYKGWVVGIATTGGSVRTLWTATTPGKVGAGIWQSGGGLVSDGAGQIILATGNAASPIEANPGLASTPPYKLGQSVVRLTVQTDGSLKATDFFAAYDANELDWWDADLGAGGPIYLPPQYYGTPSVPRLILEIGKQGFLVAMNADKLGGFKQGANGADAVVQRLGSFGGAWSKPSVWGGDGGWLYVTTAGSSSYGNSGYMFALKYGVDGDGNPTFTQQGLTSDGFPFGSGSPVVTSSGTNSGSAVVWVIWLSGGDGSNAQLRAYDPIPQADGKMKLLWSTGIGTATKFALPAISNNQVFVGTRDGHVLSFGSPVLSAMTSQPLEFPTTTVGQSATRNLILTAGAELTVNSVNSSNSAFAIGTTMPSLPAALQKNSVLTVPVTFAPTTAAIAASTITVATTSGPVTVTVTATGQAPAASLVVSPEALSVGGATVGQSTSGGLTLSNAGGQPLTINSIELPDAPFQISGLPAVGATIAAGASVAATVTFAPTQAGYFTDELILHTTGGDATVDMSATATTAPLMAVTPANIDYGGVAVGGSKLLTFTISNPGGGPLTITKSKPPIGSAFTANTAIPEGTSIPAGDSITATVLFTPTTAGAATGSWIINGNDGLGERAIGFTGTGLAFGTPTAGGWQLNGSAAASATNLILTHNASYLAGSAFWPALVETQDLKVSYDMTIDQGQGADGMTFTFGDPQDGATPSSLGSYGNGLGFAGIGGIAVTFDTYKRLANEPSSNFIGIAARSSGEQLNYVATTTAALPAMVNATHHVDITYTGGNLKVDLDGITRLRKAIALPANAYLGWTAGTGSLTDRHMVSNVVFSRVVPAPGTLSIDRTSIALGPVSPGSEGWSTFTLQNLGDTPVTVTGTVPPAAPFSVMDPIAPGTVIPAGGALVRTMLYAPASAGVHNSRYTITGSDGKSVSVALYGTSSAPSPISEGWQLNGSALISGSSLILTPNLPGQSGSAFWPEIIPTDKLRVAFDMTIDQGTGADGLTFTFGDAAAGAQANSLGSLGLGLGYLGIPGIAVTFDTYANAGEPTSDFIGIANGGTTAINYVATTSNVPALRNATHSVVITYKAGVLSVEVDGVNRLAQAITLPTNAFVGWTAGTGSLTNRHSISNLTFSRDP